ncbi:MULTISPECIES: DUF1256 domain-containing protein [Clostridium]|uniref:DUF1256 domain-containing protein n=1 Tax=Clostridium TaxID=1485 RepID=UPI00082624D8|nr:MULTISPECIES: DUF1256 domain-containing protein [Clostridium]PJI10115.1 DUF1256 domain-containing protein [Clostridium sp. CT7]
MEKNKYLQKYYYEIGIEKEFSKLLCNMTQQDRDVILLCIGNPTINGDILAPLVGTLLEEKGLNNIYGTIKKPIDRNNIKIAYNYILNKYKAPYVIVIGTSFPLDFHDDKEVIILSDTPYELWTSYGNLKFGNVSFKAIFNLLDDYCGIDIIKEVGLGMIYKYARVIFKSIELYLHNQYYVK